MDEKSLSLLPSKSVVVDLAISTSGNVTGSRYDQIVDVSNGVSIMNISGYPKTEPQESSETYAKCVYSLITEIMSPNGNVSFTNKLIQEIWVTHQRQRHDAIYSQFDEEDHYQLKPRCRM